MGTRRQFVITQWDWLTVQLRLYSLESRGNAYSVMFDFEREESEISQVRCSIYAHQTQRMIDGKASKKEQLSYYRDWAAGERQQILRIAKSIPGINARRLVRDLLLFEIMYDYGMGASVVCEIKGRAVRWRDSI